MRVAAAAGADAVGFVTEVDKETPRAVNPSWAAALSNLVNPFVTTVTVTMPDTVDDAEALLKRTQTDAIQVHADWDAAQFSDLRNRVAADVLAAVDAEDLDCIHDLEDQVDAVVVDSATETGAGGTGETHDWDALSDLVVDYSTPIVLAGGLTPDNVAEAIETVEPFAVDVSTGVEIPGGDGAKDDEAIRNFCQNAGRGLDTGFVHPGGPGGAI
jgi:phosphoribosylanthranilate isomerase